MKKTSLLRVLYLVVILLLSWSSMAINTTDTRLMHQPAISSTHIVFVYANDLWIADADGSNVRRLTSDAGIESNPCFSPDGKLIAFSAEYEGNTDVYTIPVEGGMPQRLTWHPSADNVRGFTPDGKAVLFASSREDFSNRYTQFFTIALSGGFPTKLVIPNGFQASYSPDGKQMAYTPIPPRFQQWKNYRGGTVSNIWVFNFDNYETVKIPMAENRSNDWNPMWMDKTIYFLSDRNGEFNLFSYNTDTKAIIQLTQYSDFPINSANATGKNIIFEQAGKLHIFPIKQASISFISVHRMAKVNRALTRLPAPGFMLFRSGHPTVNSLPSAITDATFIYSMLLQEPSKKLIQTNFMFPGRFVIFLAIGQPIRAGSHTQKLLQLISNRFLFILLNRENHFLLPMD